MKFYTFLLKYFYSWYILPLLFLHEFIHYLFSVICCVKLKDIKIIKTKYNLLNISLKFEHTFLFKHVIINYSPLILFSTFILMFFYPIFIYISIYFVTTIFIFEKRFVWLLLPSKNDINFYKNWRYSEYLIEHVGFENFSKSENLNKLAKDNHLFSRGEFYVYNKWKK